MVKMFKVQGHNRKTQAQSLLAWPTTADKQT